MLGPLRRRLVWCLPVAAALVVTGLFATWGKTIVAGDGPEYLMMLESWFRHGTPDQRAADAIALARWVQPMPERVHSGYFVTADGRWYSYHFWLYSLLGVPFKALLRLVHGDELEAFRWLNVTALVATVAVALRARSMPRSRRALFVVLAAVSPVLWTVRWPHAEVLVWAALTLGVLAFDARRYVLASALFATAATQSQPLALFALLAVGCAVRERPKRDAALALGVASVAALPPIFYAWHFGRANLMADAGLLDARLVGVRRFLSLLIDPDLGLLVHAPAALVLGALGVVTLARRRDGRAMALATCALVAMASFGATVNWNAGSCGLLRYGVYVLPILAWLAARGLPRGSAAMGAAFVLVLVQAARVPSRFGADDSLFHDAAADWLYRQAPGLYDPVPETFVERTVGAPTDAPWLPLPLPVGFADGRTVRKLLVDRDTAALLPLLWDVTPSYLDEVRAQLVHADGPRYFAPPTGAVRVRAAGTPRPPLRTTFAENAVLGDGWLPVHREPTREWACARRRATLHRAGGGAVLFVRLWPLTDLTDHAVRLTIRQGARVLEDRLVFDRIAREYAAASDEEVVLETSEEVVTEYEAGKVGFCADSIGWR